MNTMLYFLIGLTVILLVILIVSSSVDSWSLSLFRKEPKMETSDDGYDYVLEDYMSKEQESIELMNLYRQCSYFQKEIIKMLIDNDKQLDELLCLNSDSEEGEII